MHVKASPVWPSSLEWPRLAGPTVSKLQQSPVKLRIAFTQFLLLVALVAIIPVLFWSSITGRWTGAFYAAALITFYSGYKLSVLAFNRASHLLQLTFWLFVYCWFGLAAAGQIKAKSFPWGADVQSDGNLLFTTAVVIAGLIAYEVGVRRGTNSGQSSKRQFFSVPSMNRFALVTFGCVAISFVSLELQGGVGAAFHTRYESNRDSELSVSTKGAGLLEGALQHTPPIIALAVTVYLLLFAPYRGVRRHALIVVLVALVLYNLVANYPPSLARVNLGSDIMAVLLLAIYRRPRWRPMFVLGMVLILTLAFPYLDYFRTAERYSAKDVQNPADVLITKGDYDAFQMLSSTIASVGDNSVDYGYHLLGSVFFFVPRAIWSEKPYGTGQTVGEHLGYINVNLSCPLWAEFYFAFGVPAVLMGFWVFGILTGRFERSVIRLPNNVAVIALTYIAGFQIFLLRGDLMNALAILAPSLLLLPCYLLPFKKS